MDSIYDVATNLRKTDGTGELNNDNDSYIHNYNVNDNVKIQQKFKKSTAEIDRVADQLVEAFNNPKFRPYYCKVAMRLSEGTINSNLELALKGNSPGRYFTWLCNQDMLK